MHLPTTFFFFLKKKGGKTSAYGMVYFACRTLGEVKFYFLVNVIGNSTAEKKKNYCPFIPLVQPSLSSHTMVLEDLCFLRSCRERSMIDVFMYRTGAFRMGRKKCCFAAGIRLFPP